MKLEEFADKVKLSQNGLADVLIQRKESTEEVQNHENPFSNSSVQVGSSVSIFPVPNINQEKLEVKTDTTELSVKHINNVIKEESYEVIANEITMPNASDDTDESKLTKAQLKAQRRAKQEAQRAAKLAKTAEKIQSSTHTPASDKCPANVKESPLLKQSLPVATEPVASKTAPKSTIETFRKVRLFSHLPECKLFDTILKPNESVSEIHPSILEIGSQYSKGIICGSNARCVALLAALRDVIKDYKTPPSKNFSRDLESKFQTYLNFLNNCRPLSVSMVNAVKFLKHQINKIESNVEEEEAKKSLCKFINNFVTEEILLAREAIGNSASAKIVDGDVILVYAYSSLIREVLCKAHNQNKRFKVVVVDSRPKLEGLEMLRCLVGKGISCSYISISAVSYVMKEVSKVITGAHALLANGCVMARLGSKQVALVASAFSVPVLVCCETYKFCERVLTDSFVHNELGEPNNLIIKSLDQKNCLKSWQDLLSLQVLNLLYDVTPPDLISMVITEKGVLPCTSVPVVLRVRHAGLHE
ncbi:LOW QUALITY PROTEIN: translation initiation factor eIF-2B subunit delta-like [Stegodyphus dumicola]|uniref:LOW QUALITY PROTEIN: translation initiation factor eIF-2B subunit delta-like n=1 Tax=Stegodyphus dumicola TaxID=202533 RepID=UPI0015B03D97|nr:LOW QUALITY PROTEIN: translation initiation factor eIF-2B subunit delta-like [Stegodyphus dumicola]